MKKLLTIFFLFTGVLVYPQMSNIEKEVLDEINLCRTNPKEYVMYIDNFLEFWDSSDDERQTAEELKEILLTMEPLHALEFSPILYESAKKHAYHIKKTGKFEHSNWASGENIQYGNEYARYAVIDLLIDHGVPDRGHRKNILRRSSNSFAVYYIENVDDDIKHLFVQQFE